jgi:hypothetical protein
MKLLINIAVLAMVVNIAAPAFAAPPDYTGSTAQSNGSDKIDAKPGWAGHTQEYGGAAPTGNWELQYFHSLSGSGIGNVPKPLEPEWNTAETIYVVHPTEGPSGSNCRSYWMIDPYSVIKPDPPLDPDNPDIEYYAKYETQSHAYSSVPTGYCVTMTWIKDPWDFDGLEVADPDGHWTLGGDISLWGDLTNSTTDEGAIGWDYGISINGGVYQDLLNIRIGMSGVSVSSHPELLLFMGDTPITVDDLAGLLEGYYNPNGWFLEPTNFDFDSFEPDNPEHLAEVFNLQFALYLDTDTAQYASVSTSQWSQATAIPEPATMVLLGLGGLLLCRKR